MKFAGAPFLDQELWKRSRHRIAWRRCVELSREHAQLERGGGGSREIKEGSTRLRPSVKGLAVFDDGDRESGGGWTRRIVREIINNGFG